MTERVELSLCIIAKNDEEHISDCLRQFKNTAGEMIVVDIGSDDRTVDIARQEGAAVFRCDWENDFSRVKNFCMDHANGRWVLFLQTNETISPKQRDGIRVLLQNPNAEAYLIFVDYNSEGFGIASPVQSLRLIRNRKENRFSYRSFEAVPDEILTGIVDSGIQIKQKFDAMLSWELKERLTLLQEETAEKRQDSYLQYMTGIVLLNQQRFEESITFLKSARAGVNFGYLFAPHLYKVLGWAHLYLEQYSEAMEALNEGIENFPFYTDLFILRGELYKQLNQPEDALRDMERCLQMRECPNLSPLIPEISNAYIFRLLGEIYEQAYNYTQAFMYFVKSYELDSTDTEMLVKAAGFIEFVESDEAAENLISVVIKQNDPELLEISLDMLMKQHAYEMVLSCIDDIALVLGEERTGAIAHSCQLMTRNIQDTADGYGPDLLLRRIENYWFGDQWHMAEELLKVINDTAKDGWPIPDLYGHIQKLFTGERIVKIILGQEEYEAARSLHNDFLWKGQEEKASILLTMLLEQPEDDRCISLAIPWAKDGDFAVIQMIFSCIICCEKKKEYIQRIIVELLRHEHMDAAYKLKELAGIDLPKELEMLLWSNSLIQKLQAWMGEVIKNDGKIIIHEGIMKPDMDKNLIDFCRNLCIQDDGGTDMELAVDEAHEKIGDSYMNKNKKMEAFLAYARALQTYPLNFNAQEKIIRLLNADTGLEALWPKQDEEDGKAWFTKKNEWVCFLRGLGHFISGRFSKALSFFNSPTENKKTGNLYGVYAACCFWLDGKEPLKTLNITMDYARMTYRICLNYILLCLRKDYLQYGDIIVLQEKRIDGLKRSM